MAQGIYTLKAPEAVNKFKSLASHVGLYVGIVVYTAIGAKVRQAVPARFHLFTIPEMEFKEFEPRFKSAKTRFKLSTGLNLETFDTILSVTNHI